jgi:hypothetical protein
VATAPPAPATVAADPLDPPAPGRTCPVTACPACGTLVDPGDPCPACGAAVPHDGPAGGTAPAPPGRPDAGPAWAVRRADPAAGPARARPDQPGAGPAWARRDQPDAPVAQEPGGAATAAPADAATLARAPGGEAPGAPGDPTAPPYPNWAVSADRGPPPPPDGPRWATTGGPGADRSPIATTAWRADDPTAAPAPVGDRRALGVPTRSVVLAGLAAAAVVVAVLALARRDDGTREGPVSPGAVGSCLRYGASGQDRRVDRLVPCDEPHDGRVLAFAGSRAGCPAETDAVLATERDRGGGDVLCVSEGP